MAARLVTDPDLFPNKMLDRIHETGHIERMLTSHQLAKLLLEQPDMPVIEYSRDDYGPAYGIQVHEDAALDENGEFVDTSYEFAEKYSSVHVKKGKVVSLR